MGRAGLPPLKQIPARARLTAQGGPCASIHHSAFSRGCTSRRAISRSITVFERAGASESGTVSRFAQAGGRAFPAAPLPPCRR